MLLPALTASLMMFATAPDTALAYAEALARAEKYEDDAAARNWRATQMEPALKNAVSPMLQACVPLHATTKPNFSVVLSFKAGAFETVRFTTDDPMAICIVDRLAAVKWPAPPHPDFAEEIHLDLSGK